MTSVILDETAAQPHYPQTRQAIQQQMTASRIVTEEDEPQPGGSGLSTRKRRAGAVTSSTQQDEPQPGGSGLSTRKRRALPIEEEEEDEEEDSQLTGRQAEKLAR